ncbi:bromodomain adjacent to zinc finger domain protein 1A [Selaginella moellendorffii]|uniref:bromodomain adjacent to zinc finger domain protein 1A n=1 Tax=Selaginella moellendorffii TaxID=88036 RepID=UPI000D1CB1FF|nr:bromodomain adjacent to zinc finger domain protein 1A [Selaginella moellendorffii]XP_024538452.1 bromodomain adjacent to zinc finger domain protein 1A [Selaginella moellendorffii]XP_024538453.1 bromodomain adjacent to zinc finger domain protein 1A [Selaginella moellendorffii]XP_024538454.1 bromodomain adjacent to zinc finger domain protein 1A [Selaginella moellendorffii]XP_024538455.1 bromodomain adjacent to zinc finger domain protein 1A [Selaginella moellendorffii]|eukprot:XP_024538451.1 bromodomain adjacent to zinc finger domain protein 1A [Selaginella moellendorffii]
MPLLRQEVFLLAETPEDLSPDEMVFQVRFTKEIFRDYDEYVRRMNLYRQKIWTCKATRREGLTYEKALVSECRAAQKAEFPKDFMGPVLHLVQFSELEIDELVDHVFTTLSDRFVPGEEIPSIADDARRKCRILDVSEQDGENGTKALKYEVGWLDGEGQITEKAVEDPINLMKRKLPFTKEALKKFIQESAYGEVTLDMPWLVRDKLARKFKIPFDPPKEEKQLHTRLDPTQRQVNQSYFDESLQDADVEYTARKRSKKYRDCGSSGRSKKKYDGYSSPSEDLMDDNLLEPNPDDPPLPERPVPSTDFPLEAECIGATLMVWDFCNSFSTLLQLSQFSLYDLEKALLYTDGESSLLSEAYFAVFRVVLGEQGVKQRLAQRRKRKVILSIDTWKDDVCDYLELEGPQKLKPYLSTIRTDCYSRLPVLSKLEIFEELIERAINTTAIRSHLDENIEEFESLSAQRRGEGLPISMRKGSRFTEKAKATESLENGCTEDVSECKPKECLHENGCLIGWLKKGKRKRNGNADANGVKREYSARCLFFNSSRQTLFRCNRVELHDEREPQTEKERAESELQKRLEHLDRELEKCTIRMSPLGRDRNYNRYWFFHREGRIFVESEDANSWSFYSSKKELDELQESLNPKGAREKALRDQIESTYTRISTSMQKRSKDVAQRIALEEANIRRSLRVQSAPRPTGFLAYVNKNRTA